MPNALKMQCPKCKIRGKHHVKETDPDILCWSSAATQMFDRLLGEDISYRTRTKTCTHCNQNFQTVEFSRHFLGKIVDKLMELETIEISRERLEEENKLFRKRLKEIADLAQAVKQEAGVE